MIRNTLRAAAGFTLGLAVYAAAASGATATLAPPAAQPLPPMPMAPAQARTSYGLPLAAPIRFSTHAAARPPYVHHRRT